MVKKIIIFLLIVIALVVITMLNKSNNKKVKKANNRKTNTIKNEKNHQEYVLDDVDTLVFAVGYNPVASPIENAHLIGDCQKVGTLKDAITNAYQITKEI